MLTLVKQEWGLKATDGSELWWNGADIGRLFIKKDIPRDAEHNWIPWAYVPCKVGEMPTHVVAVDTGHHNAASGHEKFLSWNRWPFSAWCEVGCESETKTIRPGRAIIASSRSICTIRNSGIPAFALPASLAWVCISTGSKT